MGITTVQPGTKKALQLLTLWNHKQWLSHPTQQSDTVLSGCRINPHGNIWCSCPSAENAAMLAVISWSSALLYHPRPIKIFIRVGNSFGTLSIISLCKCWPEWHLLYIASEMFSPFPPLTKGESYPTPTQCTARKRLLRNTHMACSKQHSANCPSLISDFAFGGFNSITQH